ncbi:conjugal transfer protein TraO [Pedobacter nutrimenti]|uniref:Conjugative transposon protein TraO n=1 Tax=Pedobacter nutrimenti TaxID=1241337 RepID=A0A318U5X5_9SPHI|nr:conjugal transfer protein TraO [Pedobacter nutrimenti]PYF68435.1 conjugative transposon protein TraO [Pedobacter nutrimenti]
MKNVFTLAFLLIVSITVKGQFGGKTGLGSVWHYPGQIGLELGIKRSPIGWSYGVSGSQYIQSNTYLKGTLFYDDGNFRRVSQQSVGLTAMYFYSPYSLQETVFFNIGAGVTGNYDRISRFWPKTTGAFNYGAVVGLEVEAAVADYLMITGSGTQRFLFKEAYGNKRFEIGIGVKYLIN